MNDVASLPAKVEYEKTVLGAILANDEEHYGHYKQAAAILKADDFYIEAHQLIFRSFMRLVQEGHPITLLTVQDDLIRHEQLEAAGGIYYLARLTDGMPSKAVIGHYIKGVHEAVNLRTIVKAATRAISDSLDHDNASEILRRFQEEISSLNQTAGSESQYIEFAPSFLSVQDPPTAYLIHELLPEGVLALDHGEPRTRKSWAAVEQAVALATGTPAFGLDRFAVPHKQPALYSSQEDNAVLVRKRTKAVLRGRGIDGFPETLAFSVHKGINLESAEWHDRLIRDVQHHGFRLVVLDPVRRFAPNADKGPAEVCAITTYLRRLVIETGATVCLVHHDTKPPADGRDNRRRSQKASGGDWFAASECPMSVEKIDESTSMAIPEDYKVSTDPQPFTFKLETDDPRNPTIARLIGQNADAGQVTDLVAQQKILSYLKEQKTASGSRVAKGCKMNKETALTALDQLFRAGRVDCVKATKKGQADRWFIPETK